MITEIFTLLQSRWIWFSGLLLEHLAISLTASVTAGIIGLVLGIWINEHKGASKFTIALVNLLYTIPSISLLGLLIPFTGIGNTTAIIALTIYALLPMVRNTYTGLSNIDPALLEAASGMGSTKAQLLYKIKLPLAFPVIITGLRNMVTMTIALGGIASFIGAGGLGVAIYRGITTNNAAMTVAGSLLTALLALSMDFILGMLEKVITRRQKKAKTRSLIVGGITICIAACIIITSLFSGGSKDTIRIATKPMSEQYIIGEMLKTLIEQDTDLKVDITHGVGGGTANIQPAMEKGDFDIYPEYTGTGWNVVLKEKEVYSESYFDTLSSRYKDTLNMNWVGMYGFNNTYGMAVRKDIADKYNLETYSDLAKVSSNLSFGAQYDFYERPDGFDALSDAYNLKFGKTVDMDIGLKYQAIKEGQIDVINVFTTDGQLSIADVKILKDDKSFYPSYLCGNIVRQEVLEKHPEIKVILEKMTNTITDGDMAQMNYMVEAEGKEPAIVANEYLQKLGLIKVGEN